MASSSSWSKRDRFKKLFKIGSSSSRNVLDQALRSQSPSPSPGPSKVYEAGNVYTSSLHLDATTQSDVKEGFGIAIRFTQTLLKKLPDCVDGNPVKMALSIIKTIIDIKDEIGDSKDSLAEALQRTRLLLSDAVGKVEMYHTETVKMEIDEFKRKIEEQNKQLIQFAKELESRLRHVDYENYKNKINSICKIIDATTSSFMLNMQIEIRNTTALMHDQMKEEQKARLANSLNDLNPSKKADHKTVFDVQRLGREACATGTRVKILEDVANWANDHRPNSPCVFWLTGQAGSGKSTIAFTIAKLFEKDQPTTLGASFLCSGQFPETRNVNRILPTIAYRLAHSCGAYEAVLHAQVAEKASVVNHDVNEQMQELIVGPWREVMHIPDLPVYLIVIDALDEVDNSGGSALLRILLTTIIQDGLKNMKFLVTSRTDPKIVALCATFPSKVICRLQDVPLEDTESDIKTYLELKLPNIARSTELAMVRERAGGLFIYAATVVKILTDSEGISVHEQIEILRTLLSDSSNLASAGDNASPIDELYQHILHRAFSKFRGPLLARRLHILYTFICAAERISTSTAATLMDTDDEIAQNVLQSLHAVLYIQDGRVFGYHASFPDFIFTESRSNFMLNNKTFNFYRNPTSQHSLLAASCLRIMKRGLQFNMGGISSSYLLDCENVDEISEHVKENITPDLRYSCIHWDRHLPQPQFQTIEDIDNLCNDIRGFLQLRVLFWIEAMNLLGMRNQCTPILHQARQWVLNLTDQNDVRQALARDLLESSNFATYFAGSPAAESTPHLYISSLATWKSASSLSQIWKTHFSRIPVFFHGNAGNDVPLLNMRIPGSNINAVAVSNNGTLIASGSKGGYVRIWDASTGKEVKVFGDLQVEVMSVVFSSDDMWIVCGLCDSTVQVWDLSTGECLKVMQGHTDVVNSVAFSKSNMHIVSGSDDNSLCLWDASTGQKQHVMEGHGDSVHAVAFSSDGLWIASGSADRSVRVWDVVSGNELKKLEGHGGGVNSVAISGDDKCIVSGSNDMSILLWDALTGDQLNDMWGHSDTVRSVSFARNGACTVSGSEDKSLRVWDVLTGEALRVLSGHTDHVCSVTFSTDSTRVVSGSEDGTVRVWNVSTSTETNETTGSTNLINTVVFSKNGSQVVTGSEDGYVRIWNTSTEEKLKEFRDAQAVTSVAISNNGAGTCIAWGLEDGCLRVWDGDGSTDADTKILKGHIMDIASLAFSNDGTLLVSGSRDDTVRLWEISTGAALKVMYAHTDWVNSVSFSRDGKKIVSGSDDRSVRIWDTSSGDNLMVLTEHDSWVLSVAFSSDATQVAFGSRNGIVRVWDVVEGTELNVLYGHTDWVCSVAFSSDDTLIVTGSYDNTVRVWDVANGREIQTLRGRHTTWGHSVAFLSDDRSIVSSSRDGSVIVWSLDDPIWYVTDQNWILSLATKNRLMWVPPDAHAQQRPNCRLVTGRSKYSVVDFDDPMPMGLTWWRCYTPTASTK